MNILASHPVVSIAPYLFRVEPGHVLAYRQALGEQGTRIPYAMVLRALAREDVMVALSKIADGRHWIHLAQEIVAQGELRIGVDYLCDVRIYSMDRDRFRIALSLRTDEEAPVLILWSDIGLVVR